jgi:hypothetical protein
VSLHFHLAARIDGDNVAYCWRGCRHPRSWRGDIKWNFYPRWVYRGLCGEDVGQFDESSKLFVDTGVSGEVGGEFVRAWISSRAAALAASAEEVLIMATLTGNQENFLTMRSAVVSYIQTL